MAGKSKSAKYYQSNPEARKKKAAYDKKFNQKPSQRKKRSELTQKNREADKRGVDRSGKDYDHAVGRYVSVKTNRGRREKSRVKGSKRS